MNARRHFRFRLVGDAAAIAAVTSALRAHSALANVATDADSVSGDYDLRHVQCADICALISAAGGTLRLGRVARWALALRCAREANMREDLDNESGWNSFVREIYVSRYRHRRHGRRDDRPRHWRQYGRRPEHDGSR